MRKYYNLELRKIVSVTSLKTVENISVNKDFFFPTEEHSFYEFVYVLNGEITCELNNKNLQLTTGDFNLIAPKTKHRYHTETNAKVFIICFSCKSNVLSVLDKPIFIKNKEKQLIDSLIQEIESSFKLPFVERVKLKADAPVGAQQITENIIEELLIHLLRDQLAENTIQSVKSKAELQLALVDEILKILLENLYCKISLSKICKSLFYSSPYLNNLFKAHKGITIMKYYGFLKIEESKILLKKGLSIQEVSDKLCFDNANYFTKAFKSFTGITPSKYKQRNKSN